MFSAYPTQRQFCIVLFVCMHFTNNNNNNNCYPRSVDFVSMYSIPLFKRNACIL